MDKPPVSGAEAPVAVPKHDRDVGVASAASSTVSAKGPSSKPSSATTSATHSPDISRDSSPVRHPRKIASSSRLAGTRSRKNSGQDMSPSRRPAPTSHPSSRSLSSTTTPSLPPTTKEPQIQAPTPQKPQITPDLRDNPRWPVSPRLRSPPPQLGKAGLPRKNEAEAPAISVQRPTPSPHPSETQITPAGSDTDESQLHSGVRTPARGPLETVQEVSQNNSPVPVRDALLLEKVKEKLSPAENYSDSALDDANRTVKGRPSLAHRDSGGEGGNTRAETRRTTSVPPPLTSRQSSSMSTKQVKSKPEGSTQNMTVETETVSSIPQVALTTGAKSDGANGTLKPKPSTETIKPKKDKKKARKQPPVASGNASSKADIFEAKIASAVDEANTSDSEETFVYDSNPPDSGDRTVRRFHSRTPSATSMASQADRQKLRSIYGVMESGAPAPAPKKSMKFTNTFNGSGGDTLTTGDEDGKGTGRSAGGSGRGTARHHHHIGRWGRQPGNGHPSLFDNESPFPNAAKSKLSGPTSHNGSGPTSPRNHHSTRGHLNTKRSAIQLSSSYDLDDTTGADDERAPLLSTNRHGRNGRSRRGGYGLRQAESQTYTRRSSYLNRFAACLVLTVMFLMVLTGAIGFMFATSQPMSGIQITSISNVVTSEQVLMFDLTIKAHNPNIVPVIIDQSDLEIFAKSEHAHPSAGWRKGHYVSDGTQSKTPISRRAKSGNGGDDEDSQPNVLLGRILKFDSPLTFEGSLFHQGTSSSKGEVQLASPGNGTSGGSELWQHIFQNKFDLIVKGVVKYSLPLSAHARSATVSGRTTVKPNSANDPSPQPNATMIRHTR